MKGIAVYSVLAALLAGGLVLAAGIKPGTAQRADCPGRILCPLTSEAVCRDECPLRDANRPDCPGKIECPMTGELVCADECPLAAAQADDAGVPACCRGKH